MSSPVAVVERSENQKLSTNGRCSATYASQKTCPKTCPFFGAGCYAEMGPIAYTGNRLNAAKESRPTMIAKAEAAGIRKLSGRFPLRIHVVGDVVKPKAAAIISEACAEYSAKFEQPTWGYTHNRKVPRGDWGNVSMLRSCTTVRQAETAMQAGYAAALIVADFKSQKRYYMGRGIHGIPCPVQTGLAKSCVDCRLCMKEDTLKKHKNVVLLKAHGNGRKHVLRVLEGGCNGR
jgi:hypothetical protein